MIPAGYRCLECEGYTSADDATSTGHYEGCQQPQRDMEASQRRWNDQLEALVPPTPPRGINIETPWIRVPPPAKPPRGSIVTYARAMADPPMRGDEWNGLRKIDPQLNQLSVACHREIVRVMQERVEAEERWIEGILADRGMKLDADSVARCLLETRTEHLLTGLRYEAVLKIDGYAVEPPFVYTLTYAMEPTP